MEENECKSSGITELFQNAWDAVLEWIAKGSVPKQPCLGQHSLSGFM